MSLVKGESVCNSSNESELFANFKTGGNGDSTPYILCNSTQFLNMRFYPDKNFIFGKNIDFSNQLIAPIQVPFSGVLDGNGYELSNFIVKELNGTNVSVGIFKYAHNATIKNLNVRNAEVEGYQRVGIFAGDWRGTGLIENVKVKGKVTGVTYVGGLAGLANTNSEMTIKNVQTEIEVEGVNYVGGLVSFVVSTEGHFVLENSTIMTKVAGNDFIGGVLGKSIEQDVDIINSKHIGDVTSQGKWVGGFVGQYKGGSFSNAQNIGIVSTTNDNEDNFVGGFVGEAKGATVVTDSESNSNVFSGGSYTGGFFGRTHVTSISRSVARGSITVEDDYYDSTVGLVGGFAGVIGLNSSISDSSSFVTIDAKAQYVGGIAGVLDGETSTIDNSYYKGAISGYVSNIGGLTGVFYGDSITNSFSEGSITLNNPTPWSFVGGLVGHSKKETSTYSRLYSKMNISVTSGSADFVGGLFGYLIGSTLSESYYVGTIDNTRSKVGGIAGLTKADIEYSYSMATINSSLRFVGGLVGVAQNSNVHDSFSLSTIYGSGEVGGLVGWLEGSGNGINQSYFVGSVNKVEGTTFDDKLFGQIAGLMDSGSVINDAFYLNTNLMIDHTSTSFTGNSHGLALSNAQLRNPIYYTNYNFGNDNWSNPETGFKIPVLANDYLYATFDWLRDANQGFEIATTFTYDPLLIPYPSIFIEGEDSLSGLNQNHIEEIDSVNPITTVTQNSLELSVIYPSTNSQSVTGQTLIYGECGIPGNPVVIEGDFYISSICQENNRWAAVLDVTNLSEGTINFTVSLKSLDYTQSSNIINKSIIKTNSLCEQEEADAGLFANSYLNADGDSTPFKICHAGHFANIAYFPNSNYEIVNDIDFGGNTISPIATIFRGSLDGNNHTLKNFIINKSTSVNIGLFSIINNATVKNLVISNANVTGYERVGVLSGSWVGNGTIENINLKGTVNGIRYTGGLVGLINSGVNLTMDNSNFETTVTGNNYTGGVLGYISTLGGSFRGENLVLKNTVSGQSYVGGFIGANVDPNMTLLNVSQVGNITSSNVNVGQIAGSVRGGTYSNITANGDITSSYMAKENNIGGLFGKVELTSFNLHSSSYSGNISAGGDHTGGVIGWIRRGRLNNVQSQGTLSVLDTRYNSVRFYTGGLIGKAQEETIITNSFSGILINAKTKFTGGLVGHLGGETSSISDSFYNGDIIARTAYVGGLVGLNDGASVLNSYVDSNIVVNNPTPNAYIGGLVGHANNIANDYKNVSVKSNITIQNGLADYVGGLLGSSEGGTVSECYASGDIIGARNSVGGLIGLSKGITEYCMSSGDVNASFKNAGGLIGYQIGGEVRDSFTVSDVFAGAESGGLIGKTDMAASSVSGSYAFNNITKTNAVQLLTRFGPIVGVEIQANSIDESSVYYMDTNLEVGQNSIGGVITSTSAENASSYAGFDFVSSKAWRLPQAGFQLPGTSSDYTYPILEFLGSGNTVSTFSISGTVTGLNFSSITLSLNSSEEITISAGDTSFAFSTELVAGMNYDVSIIDPVISTGVYCSLQNQSGIMGSGNINNIILDCPSLNSIAINPTTLVIGNGNSENFVALGTLSTNVEIDITNSVNWSSNIANVGTIDSAGVFTTVGNGNTTVTAEVIGLTASSAVSVYDSILPATALGWVETSPNDGLIVTASWTKSLSSNLGNQTIFFYENDNCSGESITSYPVASSLDEKAFSVENNKTYTYSINSISTDGVVNSSVCSSVMEIELLKPSPVRSVASSSTWISGELPVNSPIVSWINPSDVNIQYIRVGLGSSFGADDIISAVPVGLTNNHIFQNVNGLTECSPIFPTVSVVDSNNIESDIATDTLGFRLDNTIPEQISVLSSNGEATETATAEFSWTAPIDNCAIRYYEMAIGSSNSSQDVVDFTPIGNVTSYTAVSGANGFNLSLLASTDYYTFVRAVDYAGNKGIAQVSSSWQIVELDSNLPDFILWLDSSDKSSLEDDSGVTANDAAFNNSVMTWHDISGSTYEHDFVAPSTTASPYFQDDRIFLNGTDHYFATANHNEINLETVIEKNITLAIKTENNITDKQVIYEEGGTLRGMNIYIDNGNLHCGFWNIANDGDGAQAYTGVSTSILANKTYHVSWVFDYSNYTGPDGDDGELKCYVNNTLIGTSTTTTRVFPHSGAIGIGGKNGDTYYHDGASSGTGDHLFRGNILEVMITNESVTDNVVETIHNYLIGKWSVLESSQPSAVTISNNSSTSQSALVEWQAIDPSLFDTASYEVALGTTAGGTENIFWMDIGNVTSYQFINGVDNVTLSLVEDQNYYVSIRAVGQFGNYSEVAVSPLFQLFDIGDVQNIVLEYDFSNLSSIEDENGNDATSGNFTGNISSVNDLSSSASTHNGATAGATAPTLSGIEMILNGTDNMLSIPNSSEINTETLDQKNITISFSTAPSISLRQTLYEEGGGSRGMNIYIDSGRLYCGFWNVPNDGDGAQAFISVSKEINPSTDYVVTWRFDYSNYTTPEGEDGQLDCFLNNDYMGSANTTSRVFPHGGNIGLGGANGSTRYHDGNSSSLNAFNGKVRNVIINNTAMRADQVQGLQHHLGF